MDNRQRAFKTRQQFTKIKIQLVLTARQDFKIINVYLVLRVGIKESKT